MSEIESWNGGAVVRQPPTGAVDRHRERGLDLTPEERVARRSNRRWLLAIAIPSVAVLALALIANGMAQHNQPRGPDIALPTGYQAVRDGYFTYAVPKSWPNNAALSDNAGDIDNSGPSGWAGQHVAFRATPPTLGGTPPVGLQAFGLMQPRPFTLVGGHPVSVKGASVAFAYTATRPGGFRAAVVDAYDARAAVEIWLMVSAPPGVEQQILASLQA